MPTPNKTGSFVGTGAVINVSLGFAPSHVVVTNETDGDERFEWYSGMTDGHALKTAADGTQTRITSNGISAYAGDATNPKGFTVGTAISESTDTYRYEASASSF